MSGRRGSQDGSVRHSCVTTWHHGCMARLILNTEALTAWCERHGLKAEEIAADEVEPRVTRDGLVYELRRLVGVTDDGPAFEPVVVTVDPSDPLPPLHV